MRACGNPIMPGWSGDDAVGDGRLKIPLPYVKPEFGSWSGGPLFSPDGWPRLPPPDPGETVAAFLDRAIVGDRFLEAVTARTFQGPVSPLAVVRPADRIFGWWVEEWPYREPSPFPWPAEAELPRSYHRDRVYWLLVVEWFDRLRNGDLVMRGHRTDGLAPGPPAGAARTRSLRGDAAYPGEVVALGRWENPYMALRPRAGLFEPEQWHGRLPPPGLPWYRDLTVWPAGAAEAKQKARRRVPRKELRQWWTTEYLPLHPEPDKRPSVETQRKDAAAAFPGYAPPNERTMQNLRADKDTPSDWREPGRRPKLD
jgi:hypothetical protein